MTDTTRQVNRVLFDISYLSSCLNKQIAYLCTMDNISCIRQQADIKQINRCKDRVSELNGSFDYLSNGLELAGNNVRLKIL
ncbi:MAG: transcriptional regulator, partial [candidate division WOR-3 bacterium]